MKCLEFSNIWIHVSVGENVAWIDCKHVCPYVAPATTPCTPKLEDRADEEKNLPEPAQRRCPVAGEGRGALPSTAWSSSVPWEGSALHHTQESLPSLGPGLPRGSPAPGGCRKGTGPAGPCRAVPCPFTEGYKCSVAAFQGGT